MRVPVVDEATGELVMVTYVWKAEADCAFDSAYADDDDGEEEQAEEEVAAEEEAAAGPLGGSCVASAAATSMHASTAAGGGEGGCEASGRSGRKPGQKQKPRAKRASTAAGVSSNSPSGSGGDGKPGDHGADLARVNRGGGRGGDGAGGGDSGGGGGGSAEAGAASGVPYRQKAQARVRRAEEVRASATKIQARVRVRASQKQRERKSRAAAVISKAARRKLERRASEEADAAVGGRERAAGGFRGRLQYFALRKGLPEGLRSMFDAMLEEEKAMVAQMEPAARPMFMLTLVAAVAERVARGRAHEMGVLRRPGRTSPLRPSSQRPAGTQAGTKQRGSVAAAYAAAMSEGLGAALPWHSSPPRMAELGGGCSPDGEDHNDVRSEVAWEEPSQSSLRMMLPQAKRAGRKAHLLRLRTAPRRLLPTPDIASLRIADAPIVLRAATSARSSSIAAALPPALPPYSAPSSSVEEAYAAAPSEPDEGRQRRPWEVFERRFRSVVAVSALLEARLEATDAQADAFAVGPAAAASATCASVAAGCTRAIGWGGAQGGAGASVVAPPPMVPRVSVSPASSMTGSRPGSQGGAVMGSRGSAQGQGRPGALGGPTAAHHGALGGPTAAHHGALGGPAAAHHGVLGGLGLDGAVQLEPRLPGAVAARAAGGAPEGGDDIEGGSTGGGGAVVSTGGGGSEGNGIEAGAGGHVPASLVSDDGAKPMGWTPPTSFEIEAMALALGPMDANADAVLAQAYATRRRLSGIPRPPNTARPLGGPPPGSARRSSGGCMRAGSQLVMRPTERQPRGQSARALAAGQQVNLLAGSLTRSAAWYEELHRACAALPPLDGTPRAEPRAPAGIKDGLRGTRHAAVIDDEAFMARPLTSPIPSPTATANRKPWRPSTHGAFVPMAPSARAPGRCR